MGEKLALGIPILINNILSVGLCDLTDLGGDLLEQYERRARGYKDIIVFLLYIMAARIPISNQIYI